MGYTITSVAGNIATPVITNDPKQRPLLARWQNIWSMATMMVLNKVAAGALLPRFNNEYNIPMLQAMFYMILLVSLIYLVVSCIAVSEADKPENFTIGVEKKEKLSPKDCWKMIKGNRALQMYIVAAASDKLALQTAGNAAFTTIVFGILIGNMFMSTIFSAITMPVSIVAAIIATQMARKRGNKNALVWWTWLAIGAAVLCVAVYAFMDMSQVFKAIVPTVIFVIVRVLMAAGQNGASSCTGAMMADIAEAIIGYTTMPQPGDPATMALRALAIVMTLGMPIIGWLCTIVAMKFYPLTTEKMVEVQTQVHEMREAAQTE